MTENRFCYCHTAQQVMDEYACEYRIGQGDDVRALRDDALARIRELTPPTVSEEARERIREVLDAEFGTGSSTPVAHRIACRLIDALGYTPAPPAFCGCQEPLTPNVVHRTDGPCFHYDPASPPVVELDADDLNRISETLAAWATLDARLQRIDYGHLIGDRMPFALLGGRAWITRNFPDGEWVLRIGGGDE